MKMPSNNNKLKNFNYLNNKNSTKITIANHSSNMISSSSSNYYINQQFFNNLPALHSKKYSLLVGNSNTSLNSFTALSIRYTYYCIYYKKNAKLIFNLIYKKKYIYI
jgi:hypothetical protein